MPNFTEEQLAKLAEPCVKLVTEPVWEGSMSRAELLDMLKTLSPQEDDDEFTDDERIAVIRKYGQGPQANNYTMLMEAIRHLNFSRTARLLPEGKKLANDPTKMLEADKGKSPVGKK